MARRRNRFHKGHYNVINRSKYLGDINKIEYRSGWEKFFMEWLDNNPNVKRWNSEGIQISYFSKMDAKNRRYYVDFYVEYIDGTKMLYEVKPYKQTQPPVLSESKTRKAIARFQKEIYDYNVNIDKWVSAKDSARLSGMKFRIITERDLKQLGMVI